MINRKTILDLAEQADTEGNLLLRYLLLTVGGMLDPDGNVVDLPDGDAPWRNVSGVNGAMGRGLMIHERQIIANVKLDGHPMCPRPDAIPIELCKEGVA